MNFHQPRPTVSTPSDFDMGKDIADAWHFILRLLIWVGMILLCLTVIILMFAIPGFVLTTYLSWRQRQDEKAIKQIIERIKSQSRARPSWLETSTDQHHSELPHAIPGIPGLLYPEFRDVEIITEVSVGEQRVDSKAIVAFYGPSGNLTTLPLVATEWVPKSLYIETSRTPETLFKKLDEAVKAALLKGKSDEESEELMLVEFDGAWKIEPEGKQVIMKEDV
jgi:hypothetical protein